jgi:hypothetical protein
MGLLFENKLYYLACFVFSFKFINTSCIDKFVLPV